MPRIPLEVLRARPGPRLQHPLVLPYVAEATPAAAEVTTDATGGVLVTGADVVASTFFWIARYEESLIPERDAVGRVPQSRLREIQERITGRPLVDEYAELLAVWLEMLGVRFERRRPPFRVFLSHDVDTGIGVRGPWSNMEEGLRTLYREAIRARRLGTGLQGLGHWALRGLGVRDEPALFREIVQVDAEFGFPSFFFLMANGTHPKDATYDILAEPARAVIEAIRQAGASVGLHVGLNAHQAPAELAGEWARLRQAEPQARPVARSHFLAFFPPATWRELAEVGFRADSTLGFSHEMGFRCGTCRWFRPFDVERREVLPIWELPMAVMDVHVFHDPAVTDGARVSAVRELADRVRAHGGCLAINWHNVSSFGHYRDVYRQILRDVRGAQGASLNDLPSDEGTVIW